ncbi:MAG TPA: ketol-acid reductoisomerase [Gammaproteobacteria bacterium]|nr:ketol-acid reductoisomerase [Gammaproteobacteria bacterium]
MKLFYDADIDLQLIRARRVAVLGWGAQGKAQAANLKDSGVDVRVGLRAGSSSRAAASAAGLAVLDPAEAAAWADVVVMLIPDEVQSRVYREVLEPRLAQHATLVFAHGYNIHFRRIVPRLDLDVVMVAPNGIGDQVRIQYQAGHGVPGLVAVHQDVSGQARALAFSYGGALGLGRAGITESSFREETETDLFAEQAVLSGGLTHLISAGFETLVEAGYAPEVAYFCCLHEIKLMADMIYARGIAGMRESISSTAEFGDYTRGPRVIGPESRAAMKAMLKEIQRGEFAMELAREMESGKPVIKAGRAAARAALLDQVGEMLRKGMKKQG